MAENTNGQLFPAQTNAGFFNSLVMLKKAPVIANRIFKTLNDAKEYAGKVNDYALPGLILTVVADDDNNGAYFVQSVTSDTGKDAELIKLSFNDELNKLNTDITGQLSALTASATTLSGDVSELQSEVSGLTNDLAEVSGSVSANTSAISGNTKDINALSGSVGVNASNISILSGSVSANTSAISGNTKDINALSGSVGVIAAALESWEVDAVDVKFNPDNKTRAFSTGVTNVHNALIELDGKIVAMQTQALGITSGTAISFNTTEGPEDESGNKQELIVINVNPQALVSGATGLKTNDDNTIIDVNIPGLTSNQADNMLEVKDGKLFVSKVVETQYDVDDTLSKSPMDTNSYQIGVNITNLISGQEGNELKCSEEDNKLYIPASSTGGGLSQEEVENIVEGEVNELGLTLGAALGAELNAALSTINSYSIDEKGNVSFKQFGNSDDYPVVLFDAGEY